MNALDFINKKYHTEKGLPHFKAGDNVKVHVKIKEGDKERVQAYEGVVVSIHRAGPSSTFTVRKMSYGVGVERIFPYSSPHVDKIEVTQVGKVRRAKLYYLKNLSGKRARITAVDQYAVQNEAAAQAASIENAAVTPVASAAETAPKSKKKKTA